MRVDKIKVDDVKKNPSVLVKYVEMGNVIETVYMSKRNNRQTIKMIDGDTYMICSTGEIRECVHHDTRKDNIKGLYRTFARARALINANVTDVRNVRWCTLTYAENMRDTEKLYKDFRDFHKRFKRYCEKCGYGIPEYIVMMEPQGRGAWHAHLLYIWESVAPYIANDILRDIWGHGFVKIKKLDDVDNVGAYLTAYLGDMDINDVMSVNPMKLVDGSAGKVKNIQDKYYVKGARLDLYPVGFQMIRHSRGVKQPLEMYMTQDVANKKVSAATKTFSRAYKLVDDENNFESIIIKEQYNKIRGKKQ